MPPEGFPVWLWALLGAVLPILYQFVIGKLPGFFKFVCTWGLSALITIVVGFVFLHYSPGELVQAFAWLVATSQAVYSLMVKPAVKKLSR